MKKAYIAPSIDKYLVQNTVMLEGSESLSVLGTDADPNSPVLSKELFDLDPLENLKSLGSPMGATPTFNFDE